MEKLTLFNSLNREIGLNREWCDSDKQLKTWVARNRTVEDCRITIFSFLGRLGEKALGDADPATVVIDKIPIDTDSDYGYEVMKVVNERLCHEGIIHRINYSGRFRYYACVPRAIGFHVYTFNFPNLKHPKQALANAQGYLAKEAVKDILSEFGLVENEAIDSSTVGDTQRMSRYTNTYNKKWGRWCVPLSQDDIDKLTPFDIYRLGEKPRDLGMEAWLGGDKLWQIPENMDKPEFDKFKSSNVEVPMTDCEIEQWFDIYAVPPCLREMAKNPYLDYQERFWYIVALRDYGYTAGEIDHVLQETLDYGYYTHCIQAEDMIKRIFVGKQKNAYFKGGCQFMKQRGYCNGECGRDHPVYK